MIADYIYTCHGPNCTETHVEEYGPLAIGERPPAVQLPPGWYQDNEGLIRCPRHIRVPDEESRA